MSNTVIEKEKVTEIIKLSFKEIKKKENTGTTKTATINEIVKIVERVVNDAD